MTQRHEVRGTTRVLALLGHPVRHSRSPALHNAWLAAHDLDAVYVALDAPPTTDAAAVVRAGLWGANLTVPLKRTVVHPVCRVDRLEADAEATGAVNTLWWDGDVLVGGNTDVEGWADSATAATELSGRRAVILGAGGAAAAVAWALARHGAASVAFANRTPATHLVDRLSRLAPDVRWRQGPLHPDTWSGADLVVHALPAAAREAVEALDHDHLASEGTWFDLNYFDPAPPGFATAAARGWDTVDGHGMLEAQAARAFQRWTGIDPR